MSRQKYTLISYLHIYILREGLFIPAPCIWGKPPYIYENCFARAFGGEGGTCAVLYLVAAETPTALETNQHVTYDTVLDFDL